MYHYAMGVKHERRGCLTFIGEGRLPVRDPGDVENGQNDNVWIAIPSLY